MSPETAAAGLSSLLSLLELKKRVALVLLQLVSKAWSSIQISSSKEMTEMY